MSLTVIAVVCVAIFLFTRMDDEIRRQVEQTLGDQFPHLDVSVGAARLIEGRGVAVYDLTLSETTSTKLPSNLLVVDEILLVCDANLTQLVQGAPAIHRVVVRHPQVWISRESDGRWNLDSMWPLPECDGPHPPVVIENAQITFADERRVGLPSLVLRDVNLTIRRGEQVALAADGPSRGGVILASNQQPAARDIVEIDGTVGGPNVRRAEVHARVDLNTNSWQLDGKFQQLPWTQELMAWAVAYAGPSLSKSLSDTTLEGKLDGELVASHQPADGAVPKFRAVVQFTDGRVNDPRLPRSVTDLSCTVHCDSRGMKIQQLRGSLGSASLALQLERTGWVGNLPLAMGLRLQQVPLDKRLYAALPAMLRDQWDKYRPTGIVDAELQLTFDGARWRPNITLTGQELSFESDKFRYRVNDGSGTMRYTPMEQNRPAVLDIDLVGYGGGQPLKFVGQAYDPRPGALGWIEITGADVEIEQRMIAALRGKTGEVIESLHPQGKFNVRWRLDRTQPGQLKPRTSVRLELLDCRVNYDKFPYPLRGIHGLILAEGGRWSFRDLVSGGSRNVQCQGYLVPMAAGTELSLQFTGQEIPLDDELKQAVPEAVSQAWDEVRPGGRIDLIADVYHQTGYAKPSIRVSIQPRPETATIHPQFFPYLLDHVEGRIDYENGHLTFDPRQGVRARHGRTTVRTKGFGDFADEGAWEVQLEGLTVDHLAPRRDLLVALPPKLQKLIDQLRLTGSSFSLHNGLLKFSKASGPNASVDSQWDVELGCHQTDLQAGIELQNVHGSIRLMGESEGAKCYTAGELTIDTATFQDVQLTNIRGPMWIDDSSCLLGDWATRRRSIPARRLTANVYGGALVADAWVTYDGVPRYSAVASLRDADFQRLVTERFHNEQNYQGKVAANITLNGQGKSVHGLVGQGEVKVTDANIYEIPLLVGMLKVLRNETPDTTAFNQCDTKYRIQGRHVYLDQLDFLGDAVSLLGQGEADFDHNIKLSFHSIVGRNQIRLPLVKNFVQQVGQQTMQISVDGTLTNPVVHRQPLPGINQLLQQIQTDLNSTTPDPTPRKAERWVPGLPRWGAPR